MTIEPEIISVFVLDDTGVHTMDVPAGFQTGEWNAGTVDAIGSGLEIVNETLVATAGTATADYAWLTGTGSGATEQTGADATIGMSFSALASFAISAVTFQLSPPNNSAYTASIWSINSGSLVANEGHTSLSFGTIGAVTGAAFEFSSAVSITAGDEYAILLTRTDGTGSSPTDSWYYSSAICNPLLPVVWLNLLALASAAPATGNTPSTSAVSSFYLTGIKWG